MYAYVNNGKICRKLGEFSFLQKKKFYRGKKKCFSEKEVANASMRWLFKTAILQCDG